MNQNRFIGYGELTVSFWIELIEKLVNHGQELTVGARMDLEKKIASIDVEIAGTRDSNLAKFFQNMAGKRTYFGNLLANPATFTMSLSWLLEEKQRGLFVKYFEAARRDLGEKTNNGDFEGLAIIADPIFKTLASSAEVGHVDAIAQLRGMEKGEFALIAGVKTGPRPAKCPRKLPMCFNSCKTIQTAMNCC